MTRLNTYIILEMTSIEEEKLTDCIKTILPNAPNHQTNEIQRRKKRVENIVATCAGPTHKVDFLKNILH